MFCLLRNGQKPTFKSCKQLYQFLSKHEVLVQITLLKFCMNVYMIHGLYFDRTDDKNSHLAHINTHSLSYRQHNVLILTDTTSSVLVIVTCIAAVSGFSCRSVWWESVSSQTIMSICLFLGQQNAREKMWISFWLDWRVWRLLRSFTSTCCSRSACVASMSAWRKASPVRTTLRILSWCFRILYQFMVCLFVFSDLKPVMCFQVAIGKTWMN